MAGATIEPIPIRPGSVGAPRLAPSARSSVGGSLRAIEPKQTAWGVPSGGDSIPTPGGGRIVDYQAAFAAPGGNTTTSGIQRTSSLSRTGSATVSRQTGAAGAIPPQQQQQQQLRRLPPGLGSVTQTSRRTSNAASGEKPEDAWS